MRSMLARYPSTQKAASAASTSRERVSSGMLGAGKDMADRTPGFGSRQKSRLDRLFYFEPKKSQKFRRPGINRAAFALPQARRCNCGKSHHDSHAALTSFAWAAKLGNGRSFVLNRQ